MMHYAKQRAAQAVITKAASAKNPTNQEIEDAIKRLDLFNRPGNHLVNQPAASLKPDTSKPAAKKPTF